jgi:hypothetical protein
MTPTFAVFFLGLAVILVLAAFVAVPLMGPAEAGPEPAAPSEHDRWERQKRQALAAIKETELDYRMGKLSDDDFARMRARFEAQALEAMAALEGRGRR